MFVCEHGNVKSLIAVQWFQRLAAQRGIHLQAVSRGLTPESPVPPAIVKALLEDGFDVSAFAPQAFSAADAADAVRVVGIGVDLTSSGELGDVPLDSWEGIPPASDLYAASRDALRARIETLLTTLEETERLPR